MWWWVILALQAVGNIIWSHKKGTYDSAKRACIHQKTNNIKQKSHYVCTTSAAIKKLWQTGAKVVTSGNDILCGIYLCCILTADTILKDTFLVKEELWRSGPVCFAVIGIILWFTVLSQLVLIFLSLSTSSTGLQI